MTGDYTRHTFKPGSNYSDVNKQQGRVDLDADWNEDNDIQDRRWRAETIDLVKRSFVSRETPEAFRIGSGSGSNPDATFSIAPGRMYVDGLVAENHGAGDLKFDPVLAEERGTVPVDYREQGEHHFPAPPDLVAGTHLVYLDVWRREVTHIEDPSLLDKALGGVDTTTRTQTVWQVKTLALGEHVEQVTCSTQLAAWDRLIAAPTGRLDAVADAPPASKDPCVIAPSAGYRGIENRLYRIEIHDEGVIPGRAEIGSFIEAIPDREHRRVISRAPIAREVLRPGMFVEVLTRDASGKRHHYADTVVFEVDEERNYIMLDIDYSSMPVEDIIEIRPKIATFKWSRDNGSIVAAVDAIDADIVTVENLGRDQTRGFTVGDWVEMLDDYREYHGERGEIARILVVDEANRKLTLDRDIEANKHRVFATSIQEHRDRHTRLRRWDQKEGVHGSGVLSVSRSPVEIEDGIKVSFDALNEPKSKVFRTGDYWVFAARTADGSIETLSNAPPKGIHHHFARLAVIDVKKNEEIPEDSEAQEDVTVVINNDCRPKEDCTPQLPPPPPPEPTGKLDCCTVTVSVGDDIQDAIDSAGHHARICILPGTHVLERAVVISGSGITISGCGNATQIIGADKYNVFNITNNSSDIRIQQLYLEGASEGQATLRAQDVTRLCISGCSVIANTRGEPAIDFHHCERVEIKDNIVRGFPGIKLTEGNGIDAEHNEISGGVWITGNSSISITGNKIIGGEGPGIWFRGQTRGVQIRDNVIENMESSGITTADQIELPSDFFQDTWTETEKVGGIEDLVINGNRIVHCVRTQPELVSPDGRTLIGGGLVLTSSQGVRIYHNYIARNGTNSSESKDGYPASGVLMIACENIELSENTIIDNGIRSEQHEEAYLQVGVALLHIKAPEYPARVHGNTIKCPAGQSLVAIGEGPMSVVGNSFVSHEIFMQPILFDFNLAKLLKSNGFPDIPQELLTYTGCVLIIDYSNSDWSANALTQITDNVVTMRTTQVRNLLDGPLKFVENHLHPKESGGGEIGYISSVVIISVENIIASANQFVLNVEFEKNETVTAVCVINVAAIASSIQACGNFFLERTQGDFNNYSMCSYYSSAANKNVVMGNITENLAIVKENTNVKIEAVANIPKAEIQ